MKASLILKVVLITFVSLLVSSGFATGGHGDKAPSEVALASKAMAKSASSVIQTISFKEEEKFTRIHIEGEETLPPPLYKLSQEPLKIVVDLPNVDLHRIKNALRIENGIITEVTSTQYDEKARIEIGLLQVAPFNISREDKSLFIDVEKVKRLEETERVKDNVQKTGKAEAVSSEIKEKELPRLTSTSVTLAQEKTQKAKEIIDVFMENKTDHVAFNILADGKIENFNLFKLEGPPRLVLDIWEVGTQYPKKSIRVSNPYIKEVRIGQHEDKLRLVFDSSKPQLPSYQINRREDRLIVSLGKVPQPSEPQILLQEKGSETFTVPKLQLASSPPAPVSPEPKESIQKSTAEAPAKPVKAKIGLKEVNFKQIDDKSRITLTLSGDPQFETYRVSENMIAIDIKNAFAPKHLQRGMNTSEFDSAVNHIEIKNVKNDLRVLLKLREETPYETTKEGPTLFFDIQKPKKIVKKIEAPSLPLEPPKEIPPKADVKVEVKREEIKPVPEMKKDEKVVEVSAEKVIDKPTPSEVGKPVEGIGPEKIYTGRKISLDFKDADIKNILRLIAEVSNFNIITADDVSGKITMRLVDVPWDQALDVILQSRNLGKVHIGNVIRIAPIETLRRETQARLEEKRATERLEDTVTELIPVNYATAKEIIPQIKGVLTERGDVKVDDRTNTLIIKDIPKNLPSIKSLVKSLDTKTPQVLIEARIVEANLTFQRELGIKWGFDLGGGKATAQGGMADNMLINLPALPGSAGVVEFLFSRGTIRQLDIAISAHENKGDVKIISSPKIATLHNKEATIEQGLRIPTPKQDPQSGQISIEYVEANLKLTVTPHVTNDGHVKMNIKAKKDAPDWSVEYQKVPGIDKKEAITEVLVRDNGVVMIAGVYSIEKSDGTEGIPLLSKIPLLGWLFKRDAKEDKRKDLLIFISPKVLKDDV